MTVASDVLAIGTVHDYGDQALLMEFGSTAEVLAWADRVRDADLPGVLDIVAAARTVLLRLAGPRFQAPTRQRLSALRLDEPALAAIAGPPASAPDVVIDVVYDGADLHTVAVATGLTPEQVVAAHTGTPWRVGFGGFAPGFAYLVGGDPRLRVPRRDEPRARVPTGSVGLAGDFSGIYPRESPGGWQLIGHTDAVLFDMHRDPPALLTPGHGRRVPGGAVSTTLEILRTGPLALVQDLGRPGLAHLGVGHSGAADRRSHTLANRLVANPGEAATIEVTLGGLRARVHGDAVTIAVTGADTDPAVNGIPFGINSIHYAGDGEVISLGAPHSGLRSYLAVRGGLDVPPVLGSRSYDVMAAIGPTPLSAGDVLPVGGHTDDYPELDQAPVAAITEDLVELTVVPGPRDDWVTDPNALVHTEWVASERSDRVGMRLSGRPLRHRWPDRQLPSEGATRGAIQVPPNGLPVILGPDHPVTGGYPVIGVVAGPDVDRVAQIRPGQPVRMHWSRPRRGSENPR